MKFFNRLGFLLLTLLFPVILLVMILPTQALPSEQTLPILVGGSSNRSISASPIYNIVPTTDQNPSQEQGSSIPQIRLVDDGSFEQNPSAWDEFTTQPTCGSAIGDWSGFFLIPAYHGVQTLWGGGYCDDIPVSNSADQLIYVPEYAPVLLFQYYVSRVSTDTIPVNDYAYVHVNGAEVWRLDLTQDNDTQNEWYEGTADLSAFAGQIVNLKFGAISGPDEWTGNVLFDYVGFPGPIVQRVSPQGGFLYYTDPLDPYRSTSIQIPTGAVTETTLLLFDPLFVLPVTQTLPPGVQYAHRAFDFIAFPDRYSTFLPIALRSPGSGGTAVSAPPIHHPQDSEGESFGFELPITVTIYYSDTDVIGINEDDLRLYYWTDGQWWDAATTCPFGGGYASDPNNNYIQLSVCHLSRFGMGG